MAIMKKIMLSCLMIVLLSLSIPFTSDSASDDTFLSEEIQAYCIEIGEEYCICPELLMAIIEKESRGDADAKNGSCKGLMQISERWHSERMKQLGVTDIYDEYGNILVGTDYLCELFETYEDVGMVLMVYNGDSRAKDYYNGNEDLSDYAKGILERSEHLEREHGK